MELQALDKSKPSKHPTYSLHMKSMQRAFKSIYTTHSWFTDSGKWWLFGHLWNRGDQKRHKKNLNGQALGQLEIRIPKFALLKLFYYGRREVQCHSRNKGQIIGGILVVWCVRKSNGRCIIYRMVSLKLKYTLYILTKDDISVLRFCGPSTCMTVLGFFLVTFSLSTCWTVWGSTANVGVHLATT